MSSLYKKGSYYWWESKYKGRRLQQQSTKMVRKDFARKVANEWDLKLVLNDLSFLNSTNSASHKINIFFREYLNFVSNKKSENTFDITRGVLITFEKYLNSKKIKLIEDISVKALDDYVDWLDNAPKTKKNYLNVISLMLRHAMKYEVSG